VSRAALLAVPALLLALGCRSAPVATKDPELGAAATRAAGVPANDLVDVAKVVPGIRLDIRYATKKNFTGEVLYDEPRCFLRRDVAERLRRAQEDLAAKGRGLRVWDCYRPLSVQRRLWALVPDERYVADPAKGSRHNRGAAVDVEMVGADGSSLPAPTGYDDFSERAHRDFMDLSPDVIANRAELEQAMVRAGFEPLPTEWWHFDAKGWEEYDVLDVDFADLPR